MELIALIDGLPSNSRFIEATLNDPEYVEMLKNQPPQEGKQSPPLSTWDSHMDLLANILDALTVANQIAISAAGGKPKKPKPIQRPETLYQSTQQDFSEDQLDIISQLTPDFASEH